VSASQFSAVAIIPHRSPVDWRFAAPGDEASLLVQEFAQVDASVWIAAAL
jgi:hypothetical protein